MMYKRWLKEGLEKPGKTQTGLSEALNVDQSAVSRMLSGKRQIRAEELPRISKYLEINVPVVSGTTSNIIPTEQINVIGIAASGIWLERHAGQSRVTKTIPVMRLHNQDEYALLVEGPSSDALVPTGSFAICTPIKLITRKIRNDDLVHVVRCKNDMNEWTIRLVSMVNGQTHLTAHSKDPEIIEELVLERPDEGEKIKLMGLVTGIYTALN